MFLAMIRSLKISSVLVALIAVYVLMPSFSMNAYAGNPSVAEIEQYVRARIDMGENIGEFFKNRERPQFGPEGGPSMDALQKMTNEINDFIGGILSKHGLTIEKYQTRSPDVFADEAGLKAFLDAHPDLKKRYEVLPKSPMGGQRGH